MSCRKLSELQLWAYLDNELRPGERRAVEEHVSNCGLCGRYLQEIGGHPLASQALALAKPRPGFQARVMSRLDRQINARQPVSRAAWWPAVALSPRLAALTASALAVWAACLALAGAYLVPTALSTVPRSTPGSGTVLLSVRQALGSMQPLFDTWGWVVFIAGMLVVLVLPVVVVLTLRGRSE